MENEITYMDVKIAPKGKRSHPSRGPRSQQPVWYVATVSLGIAALSLLVTIVYLNICKVHKMKCPNVSCGDSSRNMTSKRLAVLKAELCAGQQGAVCELCPPGWQLNRSRCYYFSGENQSWEASDSDCLNRKSWLLVLEDEAEVDWVSKMRPKDDYFWIGYKYNQTQRQWTWLVDSGFSGYSSIKMDKNISGMDCASLKAKNELSSDSCKSTHRWICKRNMTVLEL
ncbi:killer cell lectin-like receptor subfamily B member 1B allele C isoform X2 [Ornithorhynchus anatinus]|uniref:C-type lectin domain-containing protein n=1 Tax=Ornithorhynchus anatinus TaxID=9258 RepID=A0A6I8NE68_ORNAN|nr:killer cell lectin-like receptor subfamily B member 1B allele C isoform X2 [Ornithorhynchus anatinus]